MDTTTFPTDTQINNVEQWSAKLLEQGYCVIPRLVDPDQVEALDRDLAPAFAETPFCQGGFYGERTKRFGRLLSRSPRAQHHVMHPLVLQIVETILTPWCDRIQLNLTQAIALHPGALPQLPHRDQDMWSGPVGEIEYLVNVIWPLTEFRADNGATRLWPNTHGGNATIVEPEEGDAGNPAAMSPGAALVFLGSTLHGAGANVSGEIRRGVVIGYSLGWLKPYENQWLAYPPEIARSFSPDLAGLIGYRQHRPNLGNYEGQCPSILLGDKADAPLAAVDALRPDQRAAVDAFVARQSRLT